MGRILHCMRAPVGGLFRHVLDLAHEQVARGHDVGIICDGSTGGAQAIKQLSDIAPDLALGVHRIAMPRLPGLGDLSAVLQTRALISRIGPDIVHGHGAKGGAYARISAASLKKDGKPLPTFYTPHGGALHYDPKTLQGRIFFGFERMAQKWTRAILFESHYGFGVYRRKIGEPTCPATVIHNGVGRADFVPVVPSGDAVDLLFIGELRQLKGVSDLLAALAILRDRGQRVAAVLVGSGPDEEVFKAEAQSLGLSERVRFAGAMPAREAFALARAIAVPSRNESLPYVVLEAAAAGLPMVATTVGGIPEIFAGEAHRLVPPSDPGRLADAIARLVDAPDRARAEAAILQETVRTRFSVSVMTDGVLKAYAEYGGLAGIAAADSRNRESAIPSVAEI